MSIVDLRLQWSVLGSTEGGHGVTCIRKLRCVRVSNALARLRHVPDALASMVRERAAALAREAATCDQCRIIPTASSEHFPHDLVAACVLKGAAQEAKRVRCQRHAMSSQGRK